MLITPAVFAEEAALEDNLVEDFKADVDGQVYKFIQPAVMEQEEVYVPLRTFFSVFGAPLTWDEQKNAAIIEADGKEYLLNMDLSGLSIKIDDNLVFPIKNISSQTYIPLSFLKEIINYEFFWDQENHTLKMVKKPEANTVFANLPEAPKFTVVETFTGTASWYGNKFHGRKTNSGEIFDENAFTCAHRTLPFNTYLRVTFLSTNASTIVRVNDRGPHVAGRILDLSKAAAEAIGLKPHGLGEVKVEVLALN
ncbi:MAG: septal ring lytic transglycosylase RlpA family protein [Clostridia bacterium]|nr:septal ring lytic transglycosylase RlpA family protein [Clostridia bacterium]